MDKSHTHLLKALQEAREKLQEIYWSAPNARIDLLAEDAIGSLNEAIKQAKKELLHYA